MQTENMVQKSTPIVETRTECKSFMDWALAYARIGCSVFPLTPNSKVPLRGSNGHKDATTNEAQIRQWWNQCPEANIGMACRLSNLLAIDLDRHSSEADGVKNFQAFIGDTTKTINTPAQRTPNNGLHLIYKHPNLTKVKGKIAPGVDIQSDGYIVLAPSKVGGKGYDWALSIFNSPISELPDCLLDAIVAPDIAPNKTGAPESLSMLSRFESECRTHPPAIQGQGGDRITYHLACKGHDFALPEEIVLQTMSEIYNPRCDPPWSGSELAEKVRNAYNYARNAVGCASPEAVFSEFATDTANGDYGEPSQSGWASPWKGAEIPSGYRIDTTGVWAQKKNESEPKYLCNALWVEALSRDAKGDNWGSIVRWVDCDGNQRQLAVPRGRLHEKGRTLIQELVDSGLYVVPGREELVMLYLGQFRPKSRVQSADRIGWIDDEKGRLVFVLPSKTVSPDPETKVVFQPERYSPTTETMHSAGTIDDWKREVFESIRNEPYMLFSVCVALLGPLLKHARLDSGGFHFVQRTTRGKTTALQVGASVWGCGADPADAPSHAFIRRWNSTTNAMEATAAAHNDNFLALDEIGTSDARDFGKLIYDLFGGQGKNRLNASANLRKQRTWRLQVLSTGEESVQSKIEEHNKTAKGGQTIRFCDIPIADSLIINASDAKTLADEVKRSCGEYFGTAGPAFLEAVVKRFQQGSELREYIDQAMNAAHARLIDADASPEMKRLGKRFALVEVAGKLAVELSILPCCLADIQNAVSHVCKEWANQADTLSDGERVIARLQDYILEKGQLRFQLASPLAPGAVATLEDQIDYTASSQFGDPAGYLYRRSPDGTDNLYLFTDKQLQLAVGSDAKLAAKSLAQAGLLYRNNSKALKSRFKLPEFEDRVPVYAVIGRHLFAGAKTE